MTAPPMLHEVVCSSCGHSLLEFSETEVSRVGPCCENLPETYLFDGTTYTAPANARDETPEDETPEDENPPEPVGCRNCGANEWVGRGHVWIRESFTITTTETTEDDDGTQIPIFSAGDEVNDGAVDSDDWSIESVECASCGARYRGNWECD